MGKYRDHRQPRSDRFDSDQGRESSGPSYFQRRTEGYAAPPPENTPHSTASSPALDAEVLWFNAEKGFGFARLSDGSDAFLHMSKLQAAGHTSLPEGAQLKVRIEVGHKGPQVSEVLSANVGEFGPAAPVPAPKLVQAPLHEQVSGEEESFGLVKRYDAIKGFGFIKLENGDNDVFVHATVLIRSGLSTLEAGQNVFVKYVRGLKGLEAHSIRVA